MTNYLTAPPGTDEGLGLAETTVARLTQRIRADILAGRLAPGARLKLRELAERYAVSHMPVRDALVKLEAEGLLDLQPNKGASVRQIDRQFLENMFDIRMVLEEMLVGRCVERASDDEIATLAPIAAAHAGAVARRDTPAIFALNSALHRRISALGRNAEAERILEQGWELVHAFRNQSGYVEGRLDRIVAEHEALVAAISRRDRADAMAQARAHVERSRDDLMTRIAL